RGYPELSCSFPHISTGCIKGPNLFSRPVIKFLARLCHYIHTASPYSVKGFNRIDIPANPTNLVLIKGDIDDSFNLSASHQSVYFLQNGFRGNVSVLLIPKRFEAANLPHGSPPKAI